MKKIVHFTCYDVKQFGLESKFAVILAIGRSVEGVIGQFQKISILYHGRLLGFPKGRGGSRLWNSEGMGGIYDWKSEGMAEFHRWDFWSRKCRVSSLKTLLLSTFVVRK